MKYVYSSFLFIVCLFILCCEKESTKINWIVSDYKGSFKNVDYSETLIREFSPGIYRDQDIPDELKQLSLGRIEISFVYNGGALSSFMPILYYGSVNKNDSDNINEKTQFHLVVEIGHYNVIPNPVENLFYTVCYDRYPVYCRDTYIPMIAGENYNFILDKRPEGIILQLKKGTEIVNSFPSAYFPDSSQVFFKEVTQMIEKNKGDSLETILMVGKGYVGFAEGMHNFNGQVSGVKIYKYTLTESNSGYEIMHVKNQHFEQQEITYSIRDNLAGPGNTINMRYEFFPYLYEKGILKAQGNSKSFVSRGILNDQAFIHQVSSGDIGLYTVYVETVDNQGNVINSTVKPFEIWVYPKAWEFNYY